MTIKYFQDTDTLHVFVPDGDDRVGGFRIRIGSFKGKQQADMVAERLLREDKRYKPWVIRY